MQFHSFEPQLYAVALGVFGHGPISGKQGQLSVILLIFINGLNHSAPCLTLVIVDLAQV